MPTDLLLDSSSDTAIIDGDLVMGESTIQHQYCLISTAPGQLKQFPTVGVGAEGFLKDETPNGLLAKVKLEFQKDGMTVRSVLFDNNNNLKVDASYKEISDAG